MKLPRTFTELKALNVYVPVMSTGTGFGYLTSKVLEALDRRGIRIDNLSPDPLMEHPEEFSRRLLDLVRPIPRRIKSHRINFMMNVPQFLRIFEGKKNVCFTMFESEDVPELFVRTVNEMDLCFVPSVQNDEAFKRSGVRVPIKIVPFGNDQEDYHFLKRDWQISDSHLFKENETEKEKELGNPFTFLHIGETNWRKGGDLALKAFKKVFPRDKRDVRICFKFSLGYTPPWYLEKLKNVKDERIILLKDQLSLEEMRQLYGWSHCFLGCSRGEGWGLLGWQALATGCPAIITDWGGMAEYAHLALPLDYTIKYSEAVYYGSEWGNYPEPDFDHLCDLMKYAYENPDAIAAKGEAAAKEIRDNFTWDQVAEKIVRRLEEI